MPKLEPVRALLNPKFEGYRLDPVPEADAVARFPLPRTATQATVSGRALLSFEEVQSRVRHNHLAVGSGGPGGRALYVDAEMGVVLVTLDPVSADRPVDPLVSHAQREVGDL
jgi:hypothetical protein